MQLVSTPLKSTVLFLGLGLAAILTALAFEHIGGYKPCPLCLQERYAYYLAIPLGLGTIGALKAGKNYIAATLIAAAGIAYLINSGLGFYHSGIEWHWWPGPSTCSGEANLASDAGSLIESLGTIKVIRCDEAPWRMFGLSFAGWSMVVSFFLGILSAHIFRLVRRS